MNLLTKSYRAQSALRAAAGRAILAQFEANWRATGIGGLSETQLAVAIQKTVLQHFVDSGAANRAGIRNGKPANRGMRVVARF